MSSPTTNQIAYVGAELLNGNQDYFTTLKTSGFTTVIAWSLHIDPNNADLLFNDVVIVSDGMYNFEMASFATNMSQIKDSWIWEGQAQPSTIKTLLFGIGGGSGYFDDFATIANWVAEEEQGSEPGMGMIDTLWSNLQALKRAIPSIDGFDLEDQSEYSLPAFEAVAIAILCPRKNPKIQES